MSEALHPREQGVVVRNTQSEDIPKIADLQTESFPYLARYKSRELDSIYGLVEFLN
jgi:hypothetical protein